MNRDRNDRDRERDPRDHERDPHRERERELRERDREYVRDMRDRDRFPPPPPVRSSSFMHGLPPPTLPTPRGYFPPPSPSLGGRNGDLTQTGSGGAPHNDLAGWASGSRGTLAPHGGPPGVGEMRPRWSPPPPSLSPQAKFNDRLPSMMDYSPVSGAGSATAPPRHWDGSRPPSFHRDNSREDIPMVGSSAGPATLGGGPGSEMFDDSAGPSSRSSGKHPAPPSEDDQPRKKKGRQAFSCNECSKRKQKCNRQTPCQHCVSRKVEHLCISAAQAKARRHQEGSAVGASVPTTPVVRAPKLKTEPVDRKPVTEDVRPPSSGSTPSLSNRVHKLERMMNAMVNRVEGIQQSSAFAEWRQHHPVAKSPPPERPALEPLGTHVESGSSGLTGDSWIERNSQPDEEPQRQATLGLEYTSTVGEHLEHIIEDGLSATLQKSLQDLPNKEFGDQLVDFFFEHINHLRYPIDEHLFRRAYDAVYASRSDGSTSSVISLPLIFAVLALAVRFAPVEWAGPEDTRRKRSLKFYWGAQFATTISTSLNVQNLQLVETRILLGQYLALVHERRVTEAWLMFRSAVDMAVAIGLHREDPRLRLDAYLLEYRARLWSYLCHADATLSCLVGRPLTIDPRTYDAQVVNNINLQDLVALNATSGNMTEIPSRPLEEPTFATFLILRKRLAAIVARIVILLEKVKGGVNDPKEYDEVKAIDADLSAFSNDLPPVFKFANPDKSHDEAQKYLPVHRYNLQSEILHYVIVLHRPWFLRQLWSPKFMASRKATWDAVLLSWKLREEFLADAPESIEINLRASSYEFNEAMLAGFALLIDSQGPQAADMKNILSSFVERNPVNDGEPSSTNQDQAVIIRTLYKRVLGQRSPPEGAVPLPSPQHPLDNFSSERERGPPAVSRGGADSDGTDATPKKGDGAQGLRTPSSDAGSSDDQVQMLFNQYLAITSQPSGSATSGFPVNYSPLAANTSLLGVFGVGAAPVNNSTISTADAPAAGPGHTSEATAESLSTAEVTSKQFWNNLVDVMVEQVGAA